MIEHGREGNLIKPMFVIGLSFVATGVVAVFLGVVFSTPCTGICSPGTPPNFSQAYSGVPFVIVGFALLVWSFLSKNSED